jgi:Ca2+-transporting ATPase
MRKKSASLGVQEQQRSKSDWYTISPESCCAAFAVDREYGLSGQEAGRREELYGLNRWYEQKRSSLLKFFLEELGEPMILLLLVTGLLYAIWGELSDALIIFAVILIAVSVEVYNENRAKKAIIALRELAEPTSFVRRDGVYREIPVEQIVPGDILLLQEGQRVPVDARLLESYGLALDESALTGEAVAVEKAVHTILPAATPLAERTNMVFAGTVVLQGRGSALVVGTGIQTELGRIVGLAHSVKAPRTVLQKTMRELSRWLLWLALGFSVIAPLLGWLLGRQPLQQMLLTALSLAFAFIPEEMPIIVTMVLALGGYRLAREHIIAKRLQAIETLGAITVIATDKTGTLTEHSMQIAQIYPETMKQRLLELGVLCNNAVANGRQVVGDPLETALLDAANTEGIDAEARRNRYRLLYEFAFDAERRRMTLAYTGGSECRVVMKGAPEAVLTCCSQSATSGGSQFLSQGERAMLKEHVNRMAAQGFRVLALAEKVVPEKRMTREEAESELTFIGYIGLLNPPRPEVQSAIVACHSAGIRSLMITGDHPLTARAIAKYVGMDADPSLLSGSDLDALSDNELQRVVGTVSLYARVTPEHKLRIVRALHARGERVAVTGDGINDAPALAAADIGIAMGQTGTDIAREAADMVLANDNFATIVHAIREGRLLFANLRKGVRYYLACKVALVGVTLFPTLLGVPVPFAPVQIILMELFMDLAAAAAFVNEIAEGDLMGRPPRDPRHPFMDRAMVNSILSAGVSLCVVVSLAYLVTWYSGNPARAQTVAFGTWLIGHMLLAFHLRSAEEPLIRMGIFSNRLINIWGLSILLFIILVTLFPAAQHLFKIEPLTMGEWLLILLVALVSTGWMELYKLCRLTSPLLRLRLHVRSLFMDE